MNLQRKALDLLTVAALPIGSPERLARLSALAEVYSWRALEKKMEELVDRGYVEPLKGGTAQGGLTAKGRHALEATQEQG